MKPRTALTIVLKALLTASVLLAAPSLWGVPCIPNFDYYSGNLGSEGCSIGNDTFSNFIGLGNVFFNAFPTEDPTYYVAVSGSSLSPAPGNLLVWSLQYQVTTNWPGDSIVGIGGTSYFTIDDPSESPASYVHHSILYCIGAAFDSDGSGNCSDGTISGTAMDFLFPGPFTTMGNYPGGAVTLGIYNRVEMYSGSEEPPAWVSFGIFDNRFDQVAEIAPEPSSWFLGATGFTLCAALASRSKQKSRGGL